MKRFTIILALVLLPLALLLAHGYLSGDDAAPAAEAKPQTLCPVMNMPIDKQFFADYNGKRIYFCHQGCVDAFKADPDKYMKILSDSGVTLENAPAVPPWQNLESNDNAARTQAAADLHTMRTDVQTYLLQAAQRTCLKPDPAYNGPSCLVIEALGEWRVKQAVPLLMNIVDFKMNVPAGGGKMPLYGYFPAAQALIEIGAARETLDALLARLKAGDMNERSLKLAVWCLHEILSKDYATVLLKHAADKEQDPVVKARIKAAADLSDTQKDFPLTTKEVFKHPSDTPPSPPNPAHPIANVPAPAAVDNAPEIPAWLRAIEANLPDDAIVALVDLKIAVIKEDKETLSWELKCTGDVTRFITGSDKNKQVEFEATVRSIGNGIAEEEFIGSELRRDYITAGACKDCLLVYKRNENGSINLLRLQAKGLEYAPAYEWLESTKDRKDDRPALSVVVLMDKTTPRQLRDLAFRTVAFSGLSFQTRFDIIKKTLELGVGRDDVIYGVWMLDMLAFENGMTKDNNIAVIHYFLQGLSASKDVRDANTWLSALAHDADKINPKDYADLCKEIADGVKQHEAAPAAPELRNEVATYEKLKTAILEKVAPQNPPSVPDESTHSGENGTAPPPDSGKP